jgi:uncharacterized SAM-binding protein YcdF (DUF218 family)
MRTSKYRAFLVLAIVVICLWLASRAGAFLILNDPRASDAIVVLAGETNVRPVRALELLAQGYARRIILDVPVQAKIYEFTQIQLAQDYIRDLPQRTSVSICPIEGLSTKAESKDVAACLGQQQAKSVLIVTSDFHTRRALSIYRHQVPALQFSVAAAYDESQFGPRWWTHRQWAKTFFDEWVRLLWWKLIDQWR